MATLTAEQQAARVKLIEDYKKAILPAVLADTNENGRVMAAELQKRGWEHNLENFIRVTNAILFEDKLQWILEPKKLQAQKKSQAPKSVEQIKSETARGELDRQAAARKQEADAATKKDSDAGYKAARSAVEGYLPMRRGPKGSDVIDHLEMETTKTLLKKHIESEIVKGVNGQAVLLKVAEFLQKRYEAQEQKKERV